MPSAGPNDKFQMSVEKNAQNFRGTSEKQEFYDGEYDIGISLQSAAGSTIATYSYYKNNELLLISGKTQFLIKI